MPSSRMTSHDLGMDVTVGVGFAARRECAVTTFGGTFEQGGAHLRAAGVVQADEQCGCHQRAPTAAPAASSRSAAAPTGSSGCQPTSHVPPRGGSAHALDVCELGGGASAQRRVCGLAGRQRCVDDPAERLDSRAAQVCLEALGFVHGGGFGERDHEHSRELGVAQAREQF